LQWIPRTCNWLGACGNNGDGSSCLQAPITVLTALVLRRKSLASAQLLGSMACWLQCNEKHLGAPSSRARLPNVHLPHPHNKKVQLKRRREKIPEEDVIGRVGPQLQGWKHPHQVRLQDKAAAWEQHQATPPNKQELSRAPPPPLGPRRKQ